MEKLKIITRNQFISKLIRFILGIFALVNFSFARKLSKNLTEGLNMFKISELPETGQWPTTDPFLFLVHHHDNYPSANKDMGPNAKLDNRNIGSDFSNIDGWSMYHGDKIPGFPRHPHRGFETITIVEKGLIDHADSMGFSARYGDGDVQWLTAGDGIQHSEMFPLLNQNKKNKMDFFQIWVNLKSNQKRVKPNFSMFWKDEIPKVSLVDHNNIKTEVEIIAGEYKQNNAPKPPPNSYASDSDSHLNIWKIKMDSKAKWTLPKVENGVSRTLYVYQGKGIKINDKIISSGQMVQFFNYEDVFLTCLDSQTKILLLQAKPISEPVFKYGPFVMNTREEIIEAFSDYNKTGFGEWVWEDSGPVHGNVYKKFANGDN